MRNRYIMLNTLGAALMAAGIMQAQAAEPYYNPANAASSTSKTTGYELFKTIGCPGKAILDAPCKEPLEAKAAPAPAPKDSDGDGVTDEKDLCPATPKGAKVDATGCELDGDKDGVVDRLDKCPTTPPGRKVNASGCELDGDGDGVVDGLDKCPGTPAGRKVDANGCEFDTDKDGLVDGVDKCPTVYAKTADGCPPPLVLEGVNFDNDLATLRPEAIGILERAAISLKEWGAVNVEIGGHTDSVASDDYNQSLSERRANAVRDFLISKGIAADRLSAKGYGEAKPIADNNTAEGRATNRRVEMVPQK